MINSSLVTKIPIWLGCLPLCYLFECIQIVFKPGEKDKCFLCGQMGHLAAECEGKAKRKSGEFDEKEAAAPKKPYQVSYLVV